MATAKIFFFQNIPLFFLKITLCIVKVFIVPKKSPAKPMLYQWHLIVNVYSLNDIVLSMFKYRDQPWFSVFKHSMDHEEGV